MKHLPLIAIVLVGLALRFGGIGHGLTLGDIGHPDTPKQVEAVQQYLRGEFYKHIGLSDYDGYPLFASYLTTLVIEAGGYLARPVMELAGVDPASWWPEKLTVYWIMRVLNVLLATLAIFVVWRIGKENFSHGVGLLAALFLALSPVDVAACHYASGDTAAAVFGIVSVYFAMRIHRRRAWADYVFAGFFAALAFASKYHALVICAAAGVAHFISSENVWRWHKPGSLLRLALLGCAFIGGLFFAIPGLREEPVLMVKDILHFMGYAADFGLPKELVGAGFGAKLVYSLNRNLPVLLGLFTVPVVLGLTVALLRIHRDARVSLLLAAPLLYFVMGVSQRPAAHPVYHTIMTASIFVLAAAAMARLWGAEGRARLPLRSASVALALSATTMLAHGGVGEVFFFRRDDTRPFARAWTAENLPPSYAFYPSRYSFMSDVHVGTKRRNDGMFIVSPHIRPAEDPDGFVRWFEFGLEADAIPFFRNPVMTVWLGTNSNLRADGMMPVFQRRPSEATADYIFAGLPEFFRSGRIIEVPVRSERSRVIVSKEPLRDVLVCASADAADVRLEVRLGRVTKVLRLKPYESGSMLIESPRRRMPFATGYCYYDFSVRAQHGGARVSVAFSDRERGVDLFQQGNASEAKPWLERALATEKNPTLQAMLGEHVTPIRLEGDSLFSAYGVSEKFLNRLPYLHWDARQMTRRGFQEIEMPLLAAAYDSEIRMWGKEPGVLSVNSLWLDPGCYRYGLRVRCLDGEQFAGNVSFVFSDGRDAFTNSVKMNLPADGSYTSVISHASFERMFRSGGVQIILPQGAPMAVDSFDLRPEPVATLRWLFQPSDGTSSDWK